MAAKSKHYLDIYNWIVDVINSCETIEQLESAKKLVDNFRRMFKDTSTSEYLLNLIYEKEVVITPYYDGKFLNT